MEMLSKEEIMKQLMPMVEKSEDYPRYYKRYQAACRKLSTDRRNQLLDAYEEKIKACVIFCADLGFRENLALFQDPMRRCFLEMDPEDYLRENLLFGMPHYLEAEKKITAILREIPSDACYDILSYYNLIIIAAEKIAHYKGYLFANTLLPYTQPGYRRNSIITNSYKRMMPNLLGFAFSE